LAAVHATNQTQLWLCNSHADRAGSLLVIMILEFNIMNDKDFEINYVLS